MILLGGIYQKRSERVGPLTRQFIQQVHFSKAFIGIDGWQAETGFTGRDMMRADVVNAVLESIVRQFLATVQNSARYIPIRSVPPAALIALLPTIAYRTPVANNCSAAA